MFYKTSLFRVIGVMITLLALITSAHAQKVKPLNSPQPMNMKALIFDAWERAAENAFGTGKDRKKPIPVIDLDNPDMPRQVLTFDYQEKQTVFAIFGLIIRNAEGTAIGTVQDILIDQKGQIRHFIIQNSNSKTGTLKYEMIANNQEAGLVLKPALEDSEKISPNRQDEFNLQGMLLGKGRITNQNGKKLAIISDIIIKNGQVTHIIAEYNKTLGVEGRRVAILYNAGMLIQKRWGVDWVLNQNQYANFREFRKKYASM